MLPVERAQIVMRLRAGVNLIALCIRLPNLPERLRGFGENYGEIESGCRVGSRLVFVVGMGLVSDQGIMRY